MSLLNPQYKLARIETRNQLFAVQYEAGDEKSAVEVVQGWCAQGLLSFQELASLLGQISMLSSVRQPEPL